MLDRVLELRDNFTGYDAAYVVLALGLEAPLVTCDSKLTEAQRLGVPVELIS
jgi:predicted nucleic acid-binding protein